MQSGTDQLWDKAKKETEKFLYEYLMKIEWYYGEGRAPFGWPPLFKKRLLGRKKYTCSLIIEDLDYKPLSISVKNPEEMLGAVRATVYDQFTSFESDMENE